MADILFTPPRRASLLKDSISERTTQRLYGLSIRREPCDAN